ncbi:hypothetical protein PT974_06185 [Cladobotryum mycophilum]|uniref:Endoplasmic reticulum transmembrane protein n=1 Tax=Cladobotryum mycophilum TaxID=491253 RepID=A0ABR0SKT1_9HYPO
MQRRKTNYIKEFTGYGIFWNRSRTQNGSFCKNLAGSSEVATNDDVADLTMTSMETDLDWGLTGPLLLEALQLCWAGGSQFAVFGLLMFEMSLFMLLLVPLPFTIKRRIFTFISENPLIAKIQYWMKITFVFILILFIDSVNRVYRVQLEVMAAHEQAAKGSPTAVMGAERLEVQARKFYSQRNMYLCGFTLFLSLILNRTYVMILEVMRLEDKVRAYEGTNKNTKESEKLAVAGKPGEIAGLREELKKKEVDLQTLKKQSEQLHKAYDELSDKYAATQLDGEARKSK